MKFGDYVSWIMDHWNVDWIL